MEISYNQFQNAGVFPTFILFNMQQVLNTKLLQFISEKETCGNHGPLLFICSQFIPILILEHINIRTFNVFCICRNNLCAYYSCFFLDTIKVLIHTLWSFYNRVNEYSQGVMWSSCLPLSFNFQQRQFYDKNKSSSVICCLFKNLTKKSIPNIVKVVFGFGFDR